MRIRPYQSSDAAALLDIFNSAVHITAAPYYSLAQRQAWAPAGRDFATWQARMNAMQPWVLEQGGQMLGYASLESSGYIDHFFVRGGQARQGLGTALMQHLLALAQTRHLPQLSADVSLAAQPFFAHHGFVLVEHRFSNANGLSLTEEHDIVYRPLAQSGDPAPQPAKPPLDGQAAWSRTVAADDVLLFRYSALTFNGHRIHYDRQYVTQVEGYPGLIVHGPLIATLLIDLLRRSLPGARVAAFEFKAVRPTFDLHPFSVHGRPREDGKTIDLWARDHEGFLTMQATATLA